MSDLGGFFQHPKNLSVLTAKEEEVAELVALGWSNAEVARLLFISIKTVGGHLHSIYDKMRSELDCDNRHLRSYLGVVYRELCESRNEGGTAK